MLSERLAKMLPRPDQKVLFADEEQKSTYTVNDNKVKAAACYYKKDEKLNIDAQVINTFTSLDFYSKEKSWRHFTCKNFNNIGSRKPLCRMYQEEQLQFCRTLECNFNEFAEQQTATGKACFPNLALMPALSELVLEAPPSFTSFDESYLQCKSLTHFK